MKKFAPLLGVLLLLSSGCDPVEKAAPVVSVSNLPRMKALAAAVFARRTGFSLYNPPKPHKQFSAAAAPDEEPAAPAENPVDVDEEEMAKLKPTPEPNLPKAAAEEQPAPVEASTGKFYGYCPKCGAKGISRTRELDSKDTCENGHIYPSVQCLKWRPGQEPAAEKKEEKAPEVPPAQSFRAAESPKTVPTPVSVDESGSPELSIEVKPVVCVYGPESWIVDPALRFCPKCVELDAWVEQLSPTQKESLSVDFWRVRDPEKVPDFAKTQNRPMLHWNTPDGKSFFTTGWTNYADFESIWRASLNAPSQAAPAPPADDSQRFFPRSKRSAKWVWQAPVQQPPAATKLPFAAPEAAQAMAGVISKDMVQQLLNFMGQGEVPLNQHASLRVPSKLGFQVERVGEVVTTSISEPRPLIRLKYLGLRYDDQLLGASVSPTVATVSLATFGTIKFAVE